MKPCEKGFTLIEIMIVIALIAILASIAIPKMNYLYSRYRLNSSVNEILSNMMRAKLTALERCISVTVAFTTGTGDAASYQIFIDDGGGTEANAGNRTREGTESLLSEGSLSGDVAMYSAAFSTGATSWLTFDPSGLPMDVSSGTPLYFNGSVNLSSNNEFRRVSLSAGGVLKVEKSTVAAGGLWVD